MRILLFIGWVVLFVSCKQETSSSPAPGEKTTSLQDTISKQTFDDWTANWRSLGTAFTDTLLVTYYDMPLIDLTETLGESPAEARFFHGLEDQGGGHYEAHLILAGIDYEGKVQGSFFDITRPCPPLCKPPRKK